MKYLIVSVLLMCGLVLASCSIAGQGTSDSTLNSIRTPKPTFTPTPNLVDTAVAQPGAAAADQTTNADSDTAPNPATQDALVASDVPAPVAGSPRAIISSPLVNVRLGPATTYDIVGTVERGQEFDIVGRNPEGTWWFLCCSDDDYVWVFDDLVDTDGAVDAVPITGGASETAPVVTPAPPTPAPAPVDQFNLVRQEQFAETGLVRVFLYVTANSLGLPGYTVRITKDGQQLPVAEESFGGQPAFTWPFQDARQRHQNLKIEFPDQSAAGTWEIQLVNADGMIVGPTARFTLTANDPNRELYLRYERQ
ncbi:MAG: SH3 domain-containing protein [Litorilinea sp.]